VVIGGGMTAIDIAVQSKALGSEVVTMVYRRGQENMNASGYEQEFAQKRGVSLRLWAKPRKLLGEADACARGVERIHASCRRDLRARGRLVFKAIGQNAWDELADTAQISAEERPHRVDEDGDLAARRVGRRRCVSAERT
jgi:glutamate synthase (NADPH/NADH) small chain